MYLIVNPQYSIRNENGCSFIIKRSIAIDNTIGLEAASVTLIPPFVGFILANIGKADVHSSLDSICTELGLTQQSVDIFIRKVTENTFPLQMDGFDEPIFLPKRLLVRSESAEIQKHYTTVDTLPTTAFIKKRPQTPFSLNLMITNRCTTDCIYCYAKRDEIIELRTEETLKIIENASSKGVVNITLTGGDIFARKDWNQILDFTIKKGYNPFLSTKTPLQPDEVKCLGSLGIRTIQFSLDSCDIEILSKLLRVNSSYLSKVEAMFIECSKIGINVSVRSVLTHYNSSVSQVGNLLHFLSRFSCIEKWTFTPAFYSEFKKDYGQYEVTNEQLIDIYNYTQEANLRFPVYYNKMNEDGYSMRKFSTEKDFVKYNQTCYANSYSMSVLSTGNCTVCEMLYENQDFILGNVHSMSLEEIWNSSKALTLYAKKQELIEDKTTPCNTCNIYDTCKNQLAKKVCYVDIGKIYGRGKFEYPDPRCPRAIQTNVIL